MSRLIGASLALLLVAGATLWGAGLHQPGGVEASGHSATRTFASPWVAPGDQMVVTITAQNYGAFAQVVETLPGSVRFVGSSLPDAAVDVGPDAVTFTLLGREQFTYTVEAPAVEASFGFSGFVRDQHREELEIGGDTSLRVGPPPTPGPTSDPTPTATAVPTATPTPASTPTPVPTATAVPTATPTPEPTPTPAPEPTATPTSQPTATPTQEPAAPATMTPVPVVEPDEEGGLPVWLWILPAIVAALVLGSIGYARMRR